MGNPSDGFNGKTIAMTIANFWAEVTLLESQTLVRTMTVFYRVLSIEEYSKVRLGTSCNNSSQFSADLSHFHAT